MKRSDISYRVYDIPIEDDGCNIFGLDEIVLYLNLTLL